MDTHNFSTTPL
uniref:Uncharacterized protein n=1 Tax=Lepeophtheirus salmonis TaxID=72036 RepID=A0A0K2T553_LEPSM